MTDTQPDLERDLRAGAPGAGPPPVGALVDAAVATGAIDVAYATVDSPIGPLLVATTPLGLVRVAFTWKEDVDAVLGGLAARVSPRVMEAPGRLDAVRRELDEYFGGRRRAFAVAVDWGLSRGFSRTVLQHAAHIQYGQVRTYAELAAEAGSPRAARAVGNAMATNPIPIVVPCHRVVRTGGSLGGYGGGLDRKEWLLSLESGGAAPTSPS